MNKRFLLIAMAMLAALAINIAAITPKTSYDEFSLCADCQSVLDSADPESLNDAEIAGLFLMREEEKLARDVYAYLAELWGHRVFSNITNSEQVHMDQMAVLLEVYGLEDPVVDESEYGVFNDPNMASLYRDLTTRGEVSLKEALAVGKDIEVLDINDLEELMAATNQEAILMVYDNLLKGSQNHLAAFQRQLDRY